MNPAEDQNFIDVMVLANNLNYLKIKLRYMQAAYKVLIADVNAAISAEKISLKDKKLKNNIQEISGKLFIQIYSIG